MNPCQVFAGEGLPWHEDRPRAHNWQLPCDRARGGGWQDTGYRQRNHKKVNMLLMFHRKCSVCGLKQTFSSSAAVWRNISQSLWGKLQFKQSKLLETLESVSERLRVSLSQIKRTFCWKDRQIVIVTQWAPVWATNPCIFLRYLTSPCSGQSE